MNFSALVNDSAEIMLAIAALYVAGNAARGWANERRARESHDESKRVIFEADSRTFYLLAGLQQPWVWWLVIVGSAIKLVGAITHLIGFA